MQFNPLNSKGSTSGSTDSRGSKSFTSSISAENAFTVESSSAVPTSPAIDSSSHGFLDDLRDESDVEDGHQQGILSDNSSA